MIQTQIRFFIFGRKNSFKKSGKEWALNAEFVNVNGFWTLKTWDKKPSESEVDDAKALILRSFEFYHRNLEIPSFKIEVVD